MTGHRLKAILGCAVVLGALAAGAPPAQAEWAPCEDGTIESCVPVTICDEYGTCLGISYDGEYLCQRSRCVRVGTLPPEPPAVDPDNICAGQTCVTGVPNQIDNAQDFVLGLAGTVLGIVGGLDDPVWEVVADAQATVDELRDEPICAAPFDPEEPLCVNP